MTACNARTIKTPPSRVHSVEHGMFTDQRANVRRIGPASATTITNPLGQPCHVGVELGGEQIAANRAQIIGRSRRTGLSPYDPHNTQHHTPNRNDDAQKLHPTLAEPRRSARFEYERQREREDRKLPELDA
jgi:hypothetical protein